MSAWNAYLDANTGNTYYANSVTGVVTWDIPEDYRNYLASAPVPPPTDAPPAFDAAEAPVADPAPPALPEPAFQPPAPDNWVKHIDLATGNPYYHNTSSGETRWDAPPGFVEESPPPPFPIGVEMRAPEGTPEPEDEPGALHESDSSALPPPAMSPSVEFEAMSRTQPIPLPSSSGWERFLDTKSNKYYYAHRATGRVQWDDPESELPSVNEMAPPMSPPPVTREQAVARARAKFEAAASEPPVAAPAPGAGPRPSLHGRTKSHHFLMEIQAAQPEPGAKSAGPVPRKLDMSGLNPALARMHLGAPKSGVLSDGHSPPGSGNLSDNSPNLTQGHGSRSASVIAASSAALSVIAGKPVSVVEQKVPLPILGGSGPLSGTGSISRGKAASIIMGARAYASVAPPPSGEVHKLPAPLRTDIANFKVEGFAERHFRELKTRRGLSKQKVPTEQLIRFQKEPISQCLLSSAKDHNTPAVDNFRRVMQAMGDLPAGKPPGHYAREIVHVAQKKAYLRDEIFCQICKQVTDNPVNASLVRGWKLMAVLVSAFAPTVAFEEFLLNFIAKNFQGPREVAILAPFCFWRLEKTLKSGAEATPYSMEQLDGWLERGVPSTMVLFGGSIDYIMSLQRAEGYMEPVPVFLQRLVKIIKDGGGLTTKGMFRLAGDRGETITLREQIEAKHSYEFKCQSIHVAGDLLKIWLRDLSEPLIPHKYYDECLAIGTDKKRALEFCHTTLPQSHYAVLDFLMKFLQEITSREKENSMSAENLAIVFCTNMLRRRHAEEDPAAMLKNSQREKAFVKTLIESWVSKS